MRGKEVELGNMKIALIGGKGFIGSHLNERFLDLGYEVIIIDKGDELNFKNIDIIYHLAGAINLKRGGNDSGVERAREVCRLARENKVKKIIFFSSGGAIYSNPKSEYAQANLETEKIIKGSGLDYVILRLSNVYGPRQWEEGIIPQIIKGNPVIKGDGEQKRDFIYIDDVVEVSILAKDAHGTYDIGSGKLYSINEIIKMVEIKIKPNYVGEKDIDARAIKSNFDNWKPRVDLREGLKRTVEEFYAF